MAHNSSSLSKGEFLGGQILSRCIIRTLKEKIEIELAS